MKTSTGVVILIAVILIVAVVGLGLIPGLPDFNDIFDHLTDNDPVPEDAVNMGFSDRDIFYILELLTGKSLSWIEVAPYIDSLDMTLYGIDDTTAFDIHQWYQTQNTNDGYTTLGDSVDSSVGITVYSEAWEKGVLGRSVQVGDGVGISLVYDVDVLILATDGLMTDYQSLAVVIANS